MTDRKLKVGFVYGPFCLGSDANGFDFGNLWDDPRGLTGSELSYVRLAQEMRKLGHDVWLFTVPKPGSPGEWEGMPVLHYSALASSPGPWDALCSWNEPDILRGAPPAKVRLVNLQINSFGHCGPGFDELVDVWTSPSESHRQRILGCDHFWGSTPAGHGGIYKADPNKWTVLANGCDPELYSGADRIHGRVIWASSPDRGLHWLLSQWPRIRREVPHAHLRIFYKIDSWIASMSCVDERLDPTFAEQAARARYIKEALRRLDGHGVEMFRSVSRNRINSEMASSEVLAYPCDTVSWTEGFSVTIMEACAAGVAPITTDVDALGSIYGDFVPTIRSPVMDRIGEFTDTVVRALTDEAFRLSITSKARRLADGHRWPEIASRLEQILTSRINGR